MTATAERLTTYTVSDARNILRGVVQETPVVFDSRVGRGNWLYLKLESEQKGGTFKTRGMYMGELALLESGVRRFVLASAGNAASGAAFSARELDMQGTIFMPEGTPQSKINITKALGGNNVEVRLEGAVYDDADEAANRYSSPQQPRLHAYNGLPQIAGQGTMLDEALDQRPDADIFFLPVGGGSALAGGLQALEERGSNARVVAVQFNGNNSMERSVRSGRVAEADRLDTLAEGSSVRFVGRHTLDVVMRNLDRVEFMTVDAADIGREVVLQDYQRQQLVPALGAKAFDNFPETTGLLAAAGARKYAEVHPEISDKVFVAAVTGSNSDPGKEQKVVAAWHERQRGY